MMALIIKDWRLNRPVTIAWLVVYIALPLASVLVVVADRRFPKYDNTGEIAESAVTGIVAALGTASIVIPAFGAISFARERKDRSAEFLASLPVRRARVVASKVIVTLSLCVMPWVGAIAMLALAHFLWPGFVGRWLEYRTGEEYDVFRVLVRLQVLLLGISWLLSSLVRSDVLAASVTILATIVLGIVWHTYADRMYYRSTEAHELAIRVALNGSLIIGIGGFIAGTIIALRRVSP